MPLHPWAQAAKDHWKQHRPKMYADLQAAGTLDSQATKAAQGAENEFQSGVMNGMDPYEAESSAKQNHLFPPDEEDQPYLGERPISSQDPVNLETTTASPKPIASGKEPRGRSSQRTPMPSAPSKQSSPKGVPQHPPNRVN